MLAHFSRTPSWRFFFGSGCFSVPLLLVVGAKGCFRTCFGGIENYAKKGLQDSSGKTRILRNAGVGCPIVTSGLLPSWVILPPGPWPLPRGRGGPAGNWSRLAVEARWRIPLHSGLGTSRIPYWKTLKVSILMVLGSDGRGHDSQNQCYVSLETPGDLE